MHSKKFKKAIVKKIVESASIFFTMLFMFAGIVYALTWPSGNPPQAAPGDGNVSLSSGGALPTCPNESVLVSNGVSWDCADQNFCVLDVSSWSPATSTVCSGTTFTQTSNCSTTRSATGTKDCCTPGLCSACPGPTMPADDSACGTIDCDGRNYYYTSGTASATGTNYCKYRNYADIISSRCEGLGNCKDANTSDCVSYLDSTKATCGICKYAEGACSTCKNYVAGTSCGTGKECDGSGGCVTSECIAAYKAKGGPGLGANCPSYSSAWCVKGTQSYVGHYCSGDYLYITCAEEGVMDGDTCCGSLGYCDEGVYPLPCIARYQAKTGPVSGSCPAKSDDWCVVGTQSYVDHYCSDGYLYIRCSEEGYTENYYKCKGKDTGYYDGDVISI